MLVPNKQFRLIQSRKLGNLQCHQGMRTTYFKEQWQEHITIKDSHDICLWQLFTASSTYQDVVVGCDLIIVEVSYLLTQLCDELAKWLCHPHCRSRVRVSGATSPTSKVHGEERWLKGETQATQKNVIAISTAGHKLKHKIVLTTTSIAWGSMPSIYTIHIHVKRQHIVGISS